MHRLARTPYDMFIGGGVIITIHIEDLHGGCSHITTVTSARRCFEDSMILLVVS